MKKVLLGLFALSCVSLAAETNLYLRAGGDVYGKFEEITYDGIDLNKDDADDFGWEIGIEATREVLPNFELGIGIAYQDHGKPENIKISDVEIDSPEYTSIPLYVTAKYNFNAINNFIPYIKANLGYSFNDSDDDFETKGVYGGKANFDIDDGLYCGIGGGFEYNNFTVDLMYQLNKAEGEISDSKHRVKGDYDYSRVTLSFGYKFDLGF